MNNEINSQKTWGIVGLGWLGSALAESLTATNQKTWGTHRDSFDYKNDIFPSTFCDVLFLNTPPLTSISPKEYVDKIFLHPKSKIIFTSSISVYGKNTIAVNELSPTNPLTDSARWLCEVENLINQKFADRTLILRLGGLIGKNRHPINSLSGKTQVPGGNDVINLVHLLDLVRIIMLLENRGTHNLVNVVTPFHPTKNSYYNDWAQKLKLSPVNFELNNETKKEIQSCYLSQFYSQWLVPKL